MLFIVKKLKVTLAANPSVLLPFQDNACGERIHKERLKV
jgi:hypothetical protein